MSVLELREEGGIAWLALFQRIAWSADAAGRPATTGHSALRSLRARTQTADFREGMWAFLEKRAPNYAGR